MKEHDDHADWESVYFAYRRNFETLQRQNTVILDMDRLMITTANDIVMKLDELPLHMQWQVLYQAILKLGTKSVFEFGFGFGHNLHNLKLLVPGMEVYGIDIAKRQYDRAIEMLPSLEGRLFIGDARHRLDPKYDQCVDTAFARGTIAMISNHLDAIHNMFSVAREHVVLVEDWNQHDFVADILTYSKSNQFPWPCLYMYAYDLEVGPNHLMALVCSSKPIDGHWLEELTSDKVLRREL